MKRILHLLRLISGRSNIYNALLTMGGTVLLLLLTVATGIIAARSLGPAGRGSMMALGLWSPFLATVTTLGLPSAVNVVIRSNPDRAREVFGTAAALAMAVGTFAALAAAGILPFVLASQYTPSEITFAQLCVLTAPLVLLMIIATACFQATSRFYAYNVIRVLPTAFTLIGLIVLDETRLQTAERAVLAYLLPMALIGPVGAAVACRWTCFVTRRTAANLLRYGLRAYGAEIVSNVGGSVDRLLVVALLPPVEIGIYFVARSMADAIMGLQSSLSAVLLPRAAGATKGDAVRLAGVTTRFGLAGTAAAAVVVGLAAPFLISLVYGSEFMPAVFIFRLLLIEVVLAGGAQTLGQAYLAAGRPGFLSTIQLGLSVLTACILAAVLPAGGLRAAGIALISVSVLRLLIVWCGFRPTLQETLPRLILLPKDIRRLLLPYRHSGLPQPGSN